MEIKIELLDEKCKPERMSEHAVGFDIKAGGDFILEPKVPTLVSAGFKIELPPGYEAQIRPRSGLALKAGITVLNTPGTVDPDFRGIVCVIMFNTTDKAIHIKSHDRIAQMVINKVEIPEVIFDKVNDTARGSGGFGSTGIKGGNKT
jgi:dUTP pyrophosphatase